LLAARGGCSKPVRPAARDRRPPAPSSADTSQSCSSPRLASRPEPPEGLRRQVELTTRVAGGCEPGERGADVVEVVAQADALARPASAAPLRYVEAASSASRTTCSACRRLSSSTSRAPRDTHARTRESSPASRTAARRTRPLAQQGGSCPTSEGDAVRSTLRKPPRRSPTWIRGKDRQPGEERLLLFREESVAPVDRRSQRLLPLGGIARSAGQQGNL
jgi:hypothetical protein